jgi:hypothetical protein
MRTWASVSSTKRIVFLKEKIPRYHCALTEVVRLDSGVRELSSVLGIMDGGKRAQREVGLDDAAMINYQ